MLRAFTRQVGRYAPGDQRDYPRPVWSQIARSVKLPLEKFTVPVAEAVQELLTTPKTKK